MFYNLIFCCLGVCVVVLGVLLLRDAWRKGETRKSVFALLAVSLLLAALVVATRFVTLFTGEAP